VISLRYLDGGGEVASERRRDDAPGVPLVLLLLVVAVVSGLGILRGSRMREMFRALARQYLRE
jgi:hypothetical protein